jgi:hypothetical protein
MAKKVGFKQKGKSTNKQKTSIGNSKNTIFNKAHQKRNGKKKGRGQGNKK